MTFESNYSLKLLNTFGLSVQAEYFARFNSIEELQKLLVEAKRPIMILGGGSNILFTQNLIGSVLKNEIGGIDIIDEDEQTALVQVGGGVKWHDFVIWSINNQLGGIENLSLIPGSVGAAPMQNIGAYGTEIKSVFEHLEAVHIDSLEVRIFNKDDCQFGYRYSIFKGELKGQFVICSVNFRLNKIPKFNTSYGTVENELRAMKVKVNLENISKAIIANRQRKLPDPKDIGNCGSFFKNPTISNKQYEKLKAQFPQIVGYSIAQDKTKIAAAWLIEKAGWKGYKHNDTGVHQSQALVLVNYGQAKGKDILKLSQNIQTSVQQKFDITLEPEVNII